jgi:hemolysin III
MSTNSYIFPPRKAEIANGITHAFGILFGVGVLIASFAISGIPIVHRIGLLVFACCMLEMYCVSTTYHFEKKMERKVLLRLLDHISIYFLIAGTYTPFILICLSGSVKWIFLGITWGIVVLGTIYKLFWWKRFPKISLYLYLAMGWMVVFIIKPMYQTLSLEGFIWLIAGGLSYSVGTIFYANSKPLYNHAIWHLFVLGGSIGHFMAIWGTV